MQMLDASPFSRALWYMDLAPLSKLTENKPEIVVGRATNLDGYLVEVNTQKVVQSPSKLPDNKEVELVESKKLYATYRVAPGITFEMLLELLKGEGVYPALMPTYLKGTVGGFVASNGSGIGSYKFGFVRYLKTVHLLNGSTEVLLKTVKGERLIELSTEIPLSWHGELKDGSWAYYVPESYEDLVSKEAIGKVNAYDLIGEIHRKVSSLLSPDHFIVPLRIPFDRFTTIIDQVKFIENYYAYLINFNSTSKQVALIGSIKRDDLDSYFELLRKNPEIKPFLSLREVSPFQSEIVKRFTKSTKLRVPKQYGVYSSFYLEASKCINCSYCIDRCKAFSITKNIIYSPPGKFSRILTLDQLEACFACVPDQEACPLGVKISDVMIEMVNPISKQDLARVDVAPLPPAMKAVEKRLDEKYKHLPRYILFVGCAFKYDPRGVENLIRFFLEEGESLQGYSPRVKILDGMCCGFRDFIRGDFDAAKRSAQEIMRQKEINGAVGVYFFCPEGLYVYRRFGGKDGVLLFEVVKDFVKVENDKLHVGCWSKKLGIEGNVQECAGLGTPSYAQALVPSEHRDLITVCPLATWRFLTDSVYSLLRTSGQALEFEEVERPQVATGELMSRTATAIAEAFQTTMLSLGNVIASSVPSIASGGYEFFAVIITPLLTSNIVKEVPKALAKRPDYGEIVSFVKNVIKDFATFTSLVSLVKSSLTSINIDALANSLRSSLLNSPRLDYNYKSYVESDKMLITLKNVIKNIITEKLSEAILRQISSEAI